jgi:Zn-dependent peptidase ImmA (M78 family)
MLIKPPSVYVKDWLHTYLYDIGAAETNKILRQYDVHVPPVPLRRIVNQMGIEIRETYRSKHPAYLRITKKGAEIYIKHNNGYMTSSFAIAHELAHFLICKHLWPEGYTEQTSYEWYNFAINKLSHLPLEKACNRIAGEMVVPQRLLQHQVNGKVPSIGLIRHLSWLFRVTPELIVFRLHQIGTWNIKVIISRFQNCPTERISKLRIDWGTTLGKKGSYLPRYKSIPDGSSIYASFINKRDSSLHLENLKIGNLFRGEYPVETGIFFGKTGRYMITLIHETDLPFETLQNQRKLPIA